MARADRNIDGMVGTALSSITTDDLEDGDTWALDYYLDANRAGYERLLHAVDNFDVDDALALANDHTFDNTLGEIRALPERRSEEHTSELQSLLRISYAVFCLKKKKT